MPETTFLPAAQGIGAILLHLTEEALANPTVQAAIATLLGEILTSLPKLK